MDTNVFVDYPPSCLVFITQPVSVFCFSAVSTASDCLFTLLMECSLLGLTGTTVFFFLSAGMRCQYGRSNRYFKVYG
jgi:hypothetical protein